MKLKITKHGLSFFISAVIMAVIFFLLSISSFRYYSSEIRIMVINQGNIADKKAEIIMENLVRLPGMLSFYEKLVEQDEVISELFPGKPKDEKKKLWNRMIKVNREDNSSIIKIRVTTNSSGLSKKIASGSARALIDTAAFYYNVNEEIDLRIIEEVTGEKPSFFSGWQWLAALSAVFGFFLALLIDSIFEKIALFIAKDRKNKTTVNLPPEKTEENTPAQFVENAVDEAEPWNKKSGAPPNLPIAPAAGELPTMNNLQFGKFTIREKFPEPTEAELKKRLNQLLKGEL